MERRLGGGENRRRSDTSTRSRPAWAWRRWSLAALCVLLAGGTAAGGVRAWRALSRSDALRIRTVRFHGLGHATADELLALSPVKPGDRLLSADVDAMKRALGRHPWVRSAAVARRWPPSLDVTVTEREAAALVDLSGLYLVDVEANVFKRAGRGDRMDLPVVTGISRLDYVQRRAEVEPLLAGAVGLARAWREHGRETMARLSEIHVDPGDGTTIYVGDEGTEVRLGSGDLHAKLARLEKVLTGLRAEGRRAEVLHLDNRQHPSWVTLRLADVEAGGSGAQVGGAKVSKSGTQDEHPGRGAVQRRRAPAREVDR